jgi:propionyl-CoA carboxylase alpha chain
VAYTLNRDGSHAVTLAQPTPQHHVVRVFSADEHGIELEIDGQRSSVAISAIDDRRLLHGPFGDLELLELPRFPRANRADFRGGLKAPMPGKVLSIAVSPGQAVSRGELLLVLEAMKMEHRITAPADGTVQAIRVAQGEQVANGAVLVMIEERKD